jgi:hypothetical protein
MTRMSEGGFPAVAPYLKDPLVLIGFFLFLAFLFTRYLLRQKIIPALPPGPGFRILKTILFVRLHNRSFPSRVRFRLSTASWSARSGKGFLTAS